MFNDPELYDKACNHALINGKITATYYRRGAEINGWPSRWSSRLPGPHKPRGKIMDMSVRSMIRAGWQIANTESDFELMTTLTFREPHEAPKECLRRWCQVMQMHRDSPHPWGWAMEFQRRGIVHFHVLHTLAHLRVIAGDQQFSYRRVKRKGKWRRVLSGFVGHYLSNQWIRIVGDRTEAFRRFQCGGITDLQDHPELCGLYLGQYITKQAQKQLPPDHPPAGRWWWLSDAARPKPGVVMTLKTWPYDRYHHLLFSREKLPAAHII